MKKMSDRRARARVPQDRRLAGAEAVGSVMVWFMIASSSRSEREKVDRDSTIASKSARIKRHLISIQIPSSSRNPVEPIDI
jgi:hypothetical protein